MTATVAAEMGEVAQGSVHYHALFGIGIILFLLTFAINLAAAATIETPTRASRATAKLPSEARGPALGERCPCRVIFIVRLSSGPSLVRVEGGGVIAEPLPRLPAYRGNHLA